MNTTTTTTNTKSKRAHSNEESKRSPAKRQFRNENEKRRRDLFSQLIGNLEEILNIDKQSSSNDQINKTPSQTNKLDKASILRETAVYLKKNHDNIIFQGNISSTISRTTIDRTDEIVDFSWKPSSNLVTIEEWLQIIIESMDCFLLITKSDPHNCQIVYVSRNISSLLDYSHDELLNRSLFELILSQDHDQLRDYFLKDHGVLEKCNLSWRRATADEYEQCTIIGAFRQINKQKEENTEKYLMSIVKVNTLDRTLIINNDNSINEFTTRLNLQAKFIYIDLKARQFLGYSSYELIGRTHFDFVHPDDLPIIVRAHQIWKENGNGKSDPYRFLNKGQQWVFLQTHCQVQINSWTGKPESYICTTNPLQNPSDSLQRHLSLTSSQTVTTTVQSRPTTNSMLMPSLERRNSSADTQITSFLSHLGNETYRTNIREKLNQRKSYKQAEIRVREEEIKVIEDIIQFIDEFQSKNPSISNISTTSSSTTTTTSSSSSSSSSSSTLPVRSTTIDSMNRTTQEDFANQINAFESNYDGTLFQSPLNDTIEQFSPETSSLINRQRLSKDETLNDPLISSLFSPQQGTFSISSPMTPFSNLSRPSPITSIPLSVSPPPTSPHTQIKSPSNIHPITHENQNTKSSSSSSSSSSTTTTTTDQTSKKSSFNRSLPHSLVS